MRGRILRKRVFKRVAFLDIKPVEAPRRIVQVVVRDPKLIELVDGLDAQEFVELETEPDGKDIVAKSIRVISRNLEPFPIAKKEHGPDFLLRYRHLAIRGIRYPKIFYVEHVVTRKAVESLVGDGRKRVHPPIIIASATEGGAMLFPVDRFGERKYFLSESAQLYLEAMIFALGKVFSLTTSFRMERSRTRRHLAEFRHLEAEAADYGFEDILDAQERLLKAIVRGVLEDPDAGEIVKEFRGKRAEELDDLVASSFPRITYDEAIERLRRKGLDIERGEDLGADEERALSEDFGTPFFVTLYPTEQKAFYVKRVPGRPEVCYSADLMLPRYGEVTTGGEREDDYYRLLEEIKRRGMDPEEYRRYLDLRKYGSVRHSGYGLGIERLVHRLLDLEHIRDAAPFPRFYGRSKFVRGFLRDSPAERMLIREATLEDVEDIRIANLEAFSGIPTMGFDGIREKSSIVRFIESDDFRVYVAEIDGEIAGFAMMRVKNINKRFGFDRLENPPIKDRESYAYLMYVAVRPKYQGRGIGKRLLEHMLSEARKLGKKGAFGEFTTATPAAIRLALAFKGRPICADVWYRFEFEDRFWRSR